MGGSKERKQRAIQFLCATSCFLAVLGAVLLSLATAFKSQSYKPTDFVNQVAEDWQTIPFVNITITDDWNCPEDQDLVFKRIFYGTRQACFCDRNNVVWGYDLMETKRPASPTVRSQTANTIRAGFKLDRACTYDELWNAKNHMTCWDVPA